MSRTKLLQEIRKMRFVEAYGAWSVIRHDLTDFSTLAWQGWRRAGQLATPFDDRNGERTDFMVNVVINSGA